MPNWPWVKQGSEFSVPSSFNVLPYALLIIIAKQSLRGNLKRLNTK